MPSSDNRLLESIDTLGKMDRSELLDLWHKAYGGPPFKGARNSTLIRGITHHLQCKAYGGLKPSVSRQLLKLAKMSAPSDNETAVPPNNVTKPKIRRGTQLVREWNGKTYTVHVTDKGCVLNGKTYSSLSAVAKAITGAHWSGPRFFGVSG